MTSDYGVCTVCEMPLPTQEEANEHMRSTLVGPSGDRVGHRVRVLNPTSQQETNRAVARMVAHALERCCEELTDQISRGKLSQDEVTEALRGYPDFFDEWEQWLEAEV